MGLLEAMGQVGIIYPSPGLFPFVLPCAVCSVSRISRVLVYCLIYKHFQLFVGVAPLLLKTMLSTPHALDVFMQLTYESDK